MRSILIYALMILSSCKNLRDAQALFVARHDQDDFSDFDHTSIIWRGGNGNDHVIYFYGVVREQQEKGPYIVLVDKRDTTIRRIKYDLNEDSSRVDKKKMERLIKKFFGYEVSGLSVDTNRNVIVSFDMDYHNNIIRAADRAEFDRHIRSGWKKISGNWLAME